MARYRMVRTEFWKNPLVMEKMTPEDRYFYLYLLTNPETTQIGIYRITIKQMAFDLGYSIESVQSLMERFTEQYKLIRYNPETWELAIKNWGKDNLDKGGKPVMDCIASELKGVQDRSLILYVSESIQKQDIKCLYESFYKEEEILFGNEEEEDTDRTEYEELVDPFPYRTTIRGQKEKQKEKEKQQQKTFYPSKDYNPEKEFFPKDVQEIVQFWDANGESPKPKSFTESHPTGRVIPKEFRLDLTAGEEGWEEHG